MGFSVSNTAHQLLTYKGRLLRHYGAGAGTTLEYDSDGTSSPTFDDFSGTYAETQTGLRIKGLEANSNFYFTTSDGIQKISAASATDLSTTTITSAGGIKALDLKSSLNTTAGFLTQESTVAYRLVWGVKDANQNLILGSPSERSVIYNPLTPLLATDFNGLLADLDTCNFSGGISDQNYVSTLGVASTVAASALRTALIALTTKIDNDVIITEGAINTATTQRVSATSASIVFNSSVATFLKIGDKVKFTGLATAEMNSNVITITGVSTTTITGTPTTNYAVTDGAPVVEVGGTCQRLKYTLLTQPGAVSTNPTTVELEALQTYYSTIVSNLQLELSGICTGSTFNSASATTSATVDLTFTIPAGITTAYFYQVYRTALTSSDDVVVLSTLDPGDECQLVFEANPSSSEISTGYITYHDITPDSFRGANLYTNPNTGDGILQANEVPPLAKDICLFKEYTFYANTETKQRMNISLLSVVDMVADQSTITITDGSTVNTYTFSASENIGAKKVLISTLSTPAQQVDESARSLVRVINRNSSDIVYAYYLSGPTDVPGLILLEARTLGEDKFYISANSDTTAGQFNPNLPIVHSITAESMANPTVVTSAAHGLTSGNQILISGSNSTPSVDGIRTVTVLDPDTFSVPVTVTIAGTRGGWVLLSDALASDNEVSPNRIYYSKLSQPEAVPIVNYLDVGPKDKAIYRILALRDNLFVLKEEGVYRLSGLVAPFTVSLFDGSTNLKAVDSAVVLNNLIYCFTSQGVATVSDTGVSIISRPIEDKLIKLASAQYPNFPTATFGASYESDRSYYLWTVTETSDTVATQCFRYNTFTNTWVEGDKAARSAIVNPMDDKMYISPTDTNFIEQERKTFGRSDYADREISTTLNAGNVNGSLVTLSSVTNMSDGDVIVQTQYLTNKQFNQLLTKLDTDTILSDDDYFSSLETSAGNVLNTKLDNLITKIAADAGRVATAGATVASDYTDLSPVAAGFAALQTAFNDLIDLLNNDAGVGYSNYLESNGTVIQETIITDVTASTNTIETQYAYPFIAGPALVYNHIECEVQWVPQYLQDSSMTKHVSEGTVIFEDSSYSSAIISYASDLSPGFEPTPFEGNGNGAFGSGIYGLGYYGGTGSGVPFRTLIPREKQRCRYINCKFEHLVAREMFALYGLSLTYNPTSQRAYR